MIIGIGIDIIEITRIENACRREAFVDRVFTLAEREYCAKRGAGKFASYAARFAGKEAVLKAFGTGLRNGSLQEIEIVSDVLGCPQVKLSGYFASLADEIGVSQIYISLTHTQQYAAAQVVMWGGGLCESGDSGRNAGDR